MFMLDICFNFFKALRKDDLSYITDPHLIIQTYLRGPLLYDVFITIPWGTILSLMDPRLIAFNLIKVLRLQIINNFFSPKYMNPKIRMIY